MWEKWGAGTGAGHWRPFRRGFDDLIVHGSFEECVPTCRYVENGVTVPAR